MLTRALAVATLTLVPPPSGPNVYPYTMDGRIVRVDCSKSRGSAFKVGPNIFLSVDHVTANSNCAVAGIPIRILEKDRGKDFSVFTIPSMDPYGFKVDCRGFVEGRRYLAIGFARGKAFQTAVELTGTGRHEPFNRFAMLEGIATVIPGQSGGVIMDVSTGRAVGMVNVYQPDEGWSGSRELKGTQICRDSDQA